MNDQQSAQEPHHPPQDLSASQETPPDTTRPPDISRDVPRPPEVEFQSVEIAQDKAITIPEALSLAEHEGLRVGKSTLQRWAKTWMDLKTASPVKCVLVTTRTGSSYRLDGDDLIAWAIEQRQNMRGASAPARNLAVPHETPPDIARPPETRPDAEAQKGSAATPISAQPDATIGSTAPHASTERYITRLETEVDFLRSEINTKNAQLAEMSERNRETNILVQGLQRMLSPLLGSGKRQDEPFKEQRDPTA